MPRTKINQDALTFTVKLGIVEAEVLLQLSSKHKCNRQDVIRGLLSGKIKGA